jgi:N-acetylglucosamine-6-sulfatase
MRLRGRVFLAALLAALFTAPGWLAADAPRPNVVFVLVDDLRWDALGCTGHPFVRTPHIDRLAAEGTLFANAFVTTPLCSPSRASYLTGQYAHVHGVQGNSGEAGGHQLTTFPKLLRDVGYTTAYVGKWHMGDDDAPRPGFDRWVSFRGQGDYFNPRLNIDGAQVATQGYVTDILTDYAVEFLRRPHEKPFLLYLAHKAVHSSFTPAPRHKGIFDEQPLVRAPSAQDTLAGKPVLTRKLPQEERSDQNPGTRDDVVRNQMAAVLAIDDGIGRLREVLAETKRLDDTLIIFTSDNGFFWGEHGRGDKRMAYEESIRVPLIARCPKLLSAGSRREAMVLNIDIAPTLLELGGAAIPKTIHGRSLVPLFADDAAPWRTSFLSEYFGNADNRIPGWQAVRTARWKYIHYTNVPDVDELYDVTSDRYELKNVIADPAVAATLRELRGDLQQLLTTTQP